MRLSINEYEPLERGYEINISFIDREDIIESLICKLEEITDTLTAFNESRNKGMMK